VEEELLRPKDVARMLGISVKTLWVWQRKGFIRAVRLPTEKLRYPRSEVSRILDEMGVKRGGSDSS